MGKKSCPPGTKWDILLTCIPAQPRHQPRPKPKPPIVPPTAAVQLSTADPVATLSPAVLISVAVVVTGSIVVLVLWCIIYRRQASHSNTSNDPEPGLDPLAKTEPPVKILPPPLDRNGPYISVQKETEALPFFSNLGVGAQIGLQQEEGPTICGRPLNQGFPERDRCVVMCNTLREHRIPLPATELGGTALVTTKTV